jgi:uncharacterized protein (DUF302 family)
LSRIFKISWVEKQHVFECLRHSQKEVEAIRDKLKDRGIRPLVICDFSENLTEESQAKIKKYSY